MSELSSFFTIDPKSLRQHKTFPFHLYLLSDNSADYLQAENFHPANWPMDDQKWEIWQAQFAQGKKLKVQMCQHETYIRFTQWLEEIERLQLQQDSQISDIPRASVGRWNSPRVIVPPMEIVDSPSKQEQGILHKFGQWVTISIFKKKSPDMGQENQATTAVKLSPALPTLAIDPESHIPEGDVAKGKNKTAKIYKDNKNEKKDDESIEEENQNGIIDEELIDEVQANSSAETEQEELDVAQDSNDNAEDEFQTNKKAKKEADYGKNTKKNKNVNDGESEETVSAHRDDDYSKNGKKSSKTYESEDNKQDEIPETPIDLPLHAPPLGQIPTEINEQLILLKQAVETENFLPLILSVFKDIRGYSPDTSPITTKVQLLATETLNQDNLTNRISSVCHLLAKQLGIRSAQHLIELFFASQIHHLGTLKLPVSLLTTPQIDFIQGQKELYSQHGQESINIVAGLGIHLDSRLSKMILDHHGPKYNNKITIGPSPEALAQILGICSNFFLFNSGITTGVTRSTKQASELIGQGDIIGLELHFDPQIIEKFVLLIQGKEIQETIQQIAA